MMRILLLPLVLVVGVVGMVAVGCNAAPVTDVRRNTARVALLPLVNMSGRDLAAVPAVFWESQTIQRVLIASREIRAPLEALPFPPEALVAAAHKQPNSPLLQLHYDADTKELVWRETMFQADVALLESLSDDPEWRTAVGVLWEQARTRTVDLRAQLHDSVVRHLGEVGFVLADLTDSPLGADTSPPPTGKDPAYIERLRAAAAATRANAVLTVTVEEWDWTDLFERHELYVALAAVMADPNTGRPIWNRRTGRIVCKVPVDVAHTGMIDLSSAWPRFIELLTQRLFD
ncbi:MAG: hypothetical protein AB7K09_10495 [Planctomycetota bacterium]